MSVKEIGRRLIGGVWQTDVADEGGGANGSGATTLLGPFPITKDTAELVNPAGNGALVGPALAVGTLVLMVWIKTTVDWAVETSIDEIDISMNILGSGIMSLSSGVEGWLNGDPQPVITSIAGNTVPQAPIYLRSTPGQIAVAIYTTGAMTAGAGDVYALACIP